MFVNFSYFGNLFVRAIFGKVLGKRTREARRDTLIEVSARSVHSGALGGRSKFFFGGSAQDDFHGFSTGGLFLYQVRTYR